eukprot:TRINITY_DN75194_c0_g1_i1.p1 TRINITY_DN75194_c0_g1~~TRINITY_DN75194_c0_g1_i1.p1  ORF type:complete len:1006 (-),score=104.23 TRINITY_DN75194_c0_g1_i1:30-2969(-)
MIAATFTELLSCLASVHDKELAEFELKLASATQEVNRLRTLCTGVVPACGLATVNKVSLLQQGDGNKSCPRVPLAPLECASKSVLPEDGSVPLTRKQRAKTLSRLEDRCRETCDEEEFNENAGIDVVNNTNGTSGLIFPTSVPESVKVLASAVSTRVARTRFSPFHDTNNATTTDKSGRKRVGRARATSEQCVAPRRGRRTAVGPKLSLSPTNSPRHPECHQDLQQAQTTGCLDSDAEKSFGKVIAGKAEGATNTTCIMPTHTSTHPAVPLLPIGAPHIYDTALPLQISLEEESCPETPTSPKTPDSSKNLPVVERSDRRSCTAMPSRARRDSEQEPAPRPRSASAGLAFDGSDRIEYLISTMSGNLAKLRRQESLGESEESHDLDVYGNSVVPKLLPIWGRERKRRHEHQPRRMSVSSVDMEALVSRGGLGKGSWGSSCSSESGFDIEALVSRFVRRPDSLKALVWECMILSLIAWDIVQIPMRVFELPPNDAMNILICARTVLWTLDIPASFLIGYQADGVIELKLRRIAKNYARHWLAFDLAAVALDWSVVLGGNAALKTLQLLRLLRCLKVAGVLRHILKHVHSEVLLVWLGILQRLLLIMVLSHNIACTWYYLGRWGGYGELSWVHQAGLVERESSYSYATALHWSLTQFTPGSMEVVPVNTAERFFCLCVLLLAMVTFSSLVSGMTSAMAQIQKIQGERLGQETFLRHYLNENNVSVETTGRVWSCLKSSMSKSRRRLHAAEVAALDSIPASLKSDLQVEVFGPMFVQHPLFAPFIKENQPEFRTIIKTALEEVSLSTGQEFFNPGEEADEILYVISGDIVYRRESHFPIHVTKGDWACEPCLWLHWNHCGQLAASSLCELVAVRACKVQEVMKCCDLFRRYSRCFVAFFSKYPNLLSDVITDKAIVVDLVNRASSDEADASLLVYDEGLTKVSSIESFEVPSGSTKFDRTLRLFKRPSVAARTSFAKLFGHS